MNYQRDYAIGEPTRRDVDAREGDTLLEFGAAWCPHCMAVQPALATLMQAHPNVDHVKVEDGRGKPLGRSFEVRLWPTLVLVRDGEEIARAVRPTGRDDLRVLSSALQRDSPGRSAQNELLAG